MSGIPKEALRKFSMKGQLHIDELPPVLEPEQRYIVSGTSPNKYFLVAKPDNISIRQVNDNSVHLQSMINENGYVEWRLYTRKWLHLKPKHDLFASLFYDAALEYLFLQGNNTDVIFESWNPGTINHTQYRASIKKPTSVDTAIYSTYSWQKAQENGFRRYEPLSPTGLDVMTYKFLFLR